MLERQHRSIKDSLKAAIEDMGQKYQDRWMDYLPLVLLGRRTSLQPDIGASPSELTFGTNVRIPGQVLFDPQECDGPGLQDLLQKIKIKTSNPAVQPSSHCQPEKSLPPLPDNVTHVYTRQHQTTGLQTPYEGPFRIASRPSRSTVQIEVGVYKSGEKRYETRHFNDLKIAHKDSLAAPAQRPKLGRPPMTVRVKPPSSTDGTASMTPSNQSDEFPLPQPSSPSSSNQNKQEPVARENSNNLNTTSGGSPPDSNFGRPVRTTRNPNPLYVDAIQWSPRPWSASPHEIEALNAAIGKSSHG